MPEANDLYWMQQAYDQARLAERSGEVPVGAVLVQNNQLIASGFNQVITLNDPTAHAEVVAMRAAGKTLGNYRLIDTTLYVTLEPCAMCAGALVHARVKRLVFAASDPKTGACGSVLNIGQNSALNHQLLIEGGVYHQPCSELLKQFFQKRRAHNSVKI